MSDSEDGEKPKQVFQFIRGSESDGREYDWAEGAEIVRKALAESLNAKNVAFLLGAGCSSLRVNGAEVGIPTMAPLAEEFTKKLEEDVPGLPTAKERQALIDRLGIDIGADEYARNLERLMELLHSLRFSLGRSSLEAAKRDLEIVESIIAKVQGFLWEKCTQGKFAEGDRSVLNLYETFYRKLVLRDRSLPRPWIFTTNYDLFNETAMDRLGLPYANGFSGVVERRFNPATFRYALAEQLDLTSRKWSAVDGFVYLCKIHGSISWTEDDHGLYPIREAAASNEPGKVMIYPTPAKQNASLGSPYADLFREFQSRVVREQSVLFTMGYAFGDEHINNIIYQALTIPTFRLVIFVDPTLKGEIEKLKALRDPRIWIIGGDGPQAGRKAHYFDTIIEQFLPQRPSERIDDAIRKVLEAMSPPRKREEAE
ncbi:SIR2 family protein [Rhodoblastus acidophilus]|uniref:SIR2 family protein n=1 Tax=Candidatus Rhodoblastus alkanivorans TaxID=2954117 RepID=A0ABS9ZCU4_9HYPH|nr:SIR2 family protein [Candidatus Rhodoblastus alkanivorans]MCI4679076.1 SIR2 family protein [Candidatus Rhodoblastus alkanivorans]MCI4684902.1 SIR2 family protein [Candidatus Rhodoblastus alkanivorans]MDI4643192.1 SIR2 family protein [Rhodoblastus acidophilus]